MAIDLSGLWATVVHSAEGPTQVSGLWATVIHSAEGPSQVSGLWSTYQHTGILPSVVCPDITGTVGAPATFDGSSSVSYDYLTWLWTSVPGGSAIANAQIPYPDNQAATPIDMTDNEALYHLDGTGNDTSGNTRNLTQFNTPTFPAGKVGANCIQFNGTNQRAETTVPIGTTGTMACWVQMTATPASGDIFLGFGPTAVTGTGLWRAFSYYGGGFSFFGYGADILTWYPSPVVGQWYHVVITWDAANLVSCYLNGALRASQTIAALTTPSQVLSLGARTASFSLYTPCKLDEVAIWSRVLSATEIRDIYLVQNAAVAGMPGDTLTFTPDVVGTYTVQVTNQALYDFPDPSTTADAVIAAGGGIATTFTGFRIAEKQIFTGRWRKG